MLGWDRESFQPLSLRGFEKQDIFLSGPDGRQPHLCQNNAYTKRYVQIAHYNGPALGSRKPYI